MAIRLAAVLLGSAMVCNIPVFRYALERWPASPYEVVVFHQGALGEEEKAALEALRQSGANIEVDRVNLAEPIPEKQRKLLEKLKRDGPSIAAVYPGTQTPAWSGPLSVTAARSLVDSPARRDIAKRLLDGETAVWVLLESGDRAKDDASAALLNGELRKLEKSLELPEHRPDDPPLLLETPVRIAFSTLRLSKEDPAEAAFVATLLNSEGGLQGTVTFPVFGRGRALWAMMGAGLNPDVIREGAAFLAGACACEAKEFNPGFDLLMAADWEGGLASAPARPPVPAPVLKPRPAEPVPPVGAPQASDGRRMLWIGVLIFGLLVAVTGRRAVKASSHHE